MLLKYPLRYVLLRRLFLLPDSDSLLAVASLPPLGVLPQLGEGDGGDGREGPELRVVEGGRLVVGVGAGDAEHLAAALLGPVGGGEDQALVGVRVQGIQLGRFVSCVSWFVGLFVNVELTSSSILSTNFPFLQSSRPSVPMNQSGEGTSLDTKETLKKRKIHLQ